MHGFLRYQDARKSRDVTSSQRMMPNRLSTRSCSANVGLDKRCAPYTLHTPGSVNPSRPV